MSQASHAINDFSLLCRLFGNLFYRTPTDPVLSGTFDWLAQQGLTQQWAFNTDAQSELALTLVAKKANPTQLEAAYQALFGEQGKVSCKISDYKVPVADFINFRLLRGLPELANTDHIAHLFLTASWLEDNVDSLEAQTELFEDFLLPVLSKFLPLVEQHDDGFYKYVATLSKEALAAMADELDEAE